MKKTYPKIRLLAFSFVIAFNLNAQNLVPNPSFESFTICPSTLGQINFCNNWISPTLGTVDYYNACGGGGSIVDVPDNYAGSQDAQTGNGYGGIVTYLDGGDPYKEYLQVQLTEPLIAGVCYDVEMFASLADGVNFATNSLGIFFSTTPPPTAGDGHIYLTPHLMYQDILFDTENWVPLTGTYTADGGEQYITIGLFAQLGFFDVAPAVPPGNVESVAYYFIEDVSVIQSQAEEIEATLCEGECFEYENELYCDAGVYTISSPGLCVDAVTLTIIDGEIGIADISTPPILDCITTSITLDASNSTSGPGVLYEWNGPDNFNSNIQNPEVSEPGIYTLTVRGNNLCPAEISIEVFQDIAEPDVSASVDGTINCNFSSVALNGGSNTPNVTFQWIGPGVNANTPNATAEQEGIYILTVTGENGCTSTAEVEVMEDLDLPSISAEALGSLDCNNPAVVLTGNSTTPGVTFTWNGPGVNTNLPFTSTNLPGDYTFAVFAPNGCVSTLIVTVEEEIIDLDIAAEVDGVINCVDSTVTLTGTSTVPDASYQWTGPGIIVDSAIIQTTQTGEYTFTIMTDSGCTTDTTITVSEDIEVPVIITLTPDTLNCINLVSTLIGIDSSLGGGNSYEWFDPSNVSISNELEVEVNLPGTYIFNVTNDVNGCTSSSLVDLFENNETPTIDAGEDQEITCVETMVTLDGSGSSGLGVLNYEWQNSNGDSIGQDLTYETNISGVYTLIITDSENGCTSTTSVEVFQNSNLPNIVADVSNVLTCLNTQVTLDGSASSGIGMLSYEWLDSMNVSIGLNETVDVSSAGTYTLIITDDENGCTESTIIEVEEDIQTPIPDIIADDSLTCVNLEVTLDGNASTGSGMLSYEWQDIDENIIGNEATINVSNTDTYTLIITDDANGCTAETSFTPTENITTIIADAGDNGLITCTEIATLLDGTGSSTGTSITYEWINEGNVIVGNEISVEVIETGTYTLLVTDMNNGCTASATVEVEPDANLPTADAGTGGTLNCGSDIVTLNGGLSTSEPSISYEWFDPNNVSLGSAISIDVSIPGTYTLEVSNSDNGCTASSSVEVEEDITLPSFDLNPIAALTCIDGEILVSATNPNGENLDFDWQDVDGVSIGQGVSISIDQAGEYFVVVTNIDNACTETMPFGVTADTLSPIAISETNDLITCENNSATLDGSNSTGSILNYEWFDDTNTSIGNESAVDVTTSGVYTLIIMDDDNGCTAFSTVEVLEDVESPMPDAGLNQTLDCNTNTVELNGENSSGGLSLNYEWQDENENVIGDGVNVTVSESGTYVLILTNNENGCFATDEVIVDGDFSAPQADPGIAMMLTCIDSVITLDGSNSTGSGTLEYEWQDANAVSLGVNAMIDVSAIGEYTLIVSNLENGCSDTTQIFVNENIISPIANAGTGAFLTCDETEVTLTGTGTSQSGNTLFEWFNEGGVNVGNTPDIEVEEIGVYTLVVTDETNGCTTSSAVSVLPDANLPIANAGVSMTLTCSDTIVTLDGINSSSGNMISYEWQDAGAVVLGNGINQTVSSPGVYTLIVTDGNNGCTASSSVEVFINNDLPNAIAGQDVTLTCQDNETILDGSMSTLENGMITDYAWYDENNILVSDQVMFEITEPGIYTLIITGSNGCTNSDEIEVMIDANVPQAITGPDDLLNCIVQSIELGDSNSNNGLNVSYQWTDSNGMDVGSTPTISISAPDVYTLTVINLDNNCEAESQVQILQDITAPQADAGVNETLNCNLTAYEIGGLGTSTGSGFSYQWEDENNQIIDDQITTIISNPGTYLLTVFNEVNGCSTTSTVEIDQDITTPIADAGTGGILTCSETSVTLDGTNSNGLNLSYEWQNEVGVFLTNEATVDVSESGAFILIVTNTINGCVDTAMTTVFPDENLPTALATTNGWLTCIQDSINLDGSGSSSVSGNMSFMWEDDQGGFISNQNNIDVITPGVYTLIITDTDNGCSTSTQVEVLEDINPPIADAGEGQTLVCGQTEVTLNGNAGNGNNLSYNWENDQGMTLGNTLYINVSVAGVYTFIVTNEDNGCTASSSVEVVPDTNLPTVEAGLGGTLTCETNSIILNGNGSSTGNNFTYEWQDELGNILSTDLVFETSIPGTYTLFVLNTDNNCSSQDQVVVNEDVNTPTAFADFTAAQMLDCENTSLVLDASGSEPFGDLNFQWSTIDGNIVSDPTSINPEINMPGTYWLLVTNLMNGCIDSTEIVVDQDTELPEITIEIPALITCLVTQVILDANVSTPNGDFTFLWTGNGILSGETTDQATVNQSGIFTLTVINETTGCINESTITVDENTITPTAITNADDEFDCIIESVNLSGEGSSIGQNIFYQWTGNGTIDNAATLEPTVYQAGVYTLQVTDATNGCTQTNEITVLENTNVPTGFDLQISTPECFGDLGDFSILGVSGGIPPYVYSLDGGENFSSQNIYTNLSSGTYNLIVQDAIGCEFEDVVFIDNPIEIEVDLEEDVLLTLGDNYELNAQINVPLAELDTIIWSPIEGLSCTGCQNPMVSIDEMTTYTVTVINENGCSDTDEITLRVKKDRDVYIPNAFSPNGDGLNDVFMVYAGNQVKEVTNLQIFDRWGELLFENQNFQPNTPTHGWDGYLKGEQLNPGVFVYWARVEFIDGAFFIFKGDVTITR